MTSQVFYRKWRPQSFKELVGQEAISQTLLSALGSNRVAHAYLFCGPRGTGKTSTGRIFAKALNCLKSGKGEPCNECAMCKAITEGRAMDLVEVDAASNRGIDEIRSLREKVNFSPNEARRKVYIIDEVHMLTEPAFNALLKTLEEPPAHAVFILATTEPHKLPATIISRCQRFDFRRIPPAGVVKRLTQVCEGEKVDAEVAALAAVARAAGGSLRDAENILEHLVVGSGPRLTLQVVQEALGMAGAGCARELAKYAVLGDTAAGLGLLERAQREGLELRHVHRELMEYLRELLLVKAGAPDSVDAPADVKEEMKNVLKSVSLPRVLQAVRVFSQADPRLEGGSPLPLEMALVELATETPVQQKPQVVLKAATTPIPAPSTAPRPRPRQEAPVHTPPPTPAPRPRPQVEATQEESEKPAAAKPAVAAQAPAIEQPPRTEPPREVAAVATPGVEGDLKKLRANWKPMVETLRGKGQRYKLDALLRSACEVVAVDEEAVTLAFSYPIYVDRINEEMGNPVSRKALEDAIGKVLGKRHRVKFTLASKGVPKASNVTAGGHLLRAAIEMGARPIDEKEGNVLEQEPIAPGTGASNKAGEGPG